MKDSEITSVSARRVWDSRGNPTVEAEVCLSCGALGRAIAPAGASRGSREAVDLRDGGTQFGGQNVMNAVSNVNSLIALDLTGRDAFDQQAIDDALIALDGTPFKSLLGANATVAVSMAVLHAAASAKQVALWQHIADLSGRTPTIPLPEIQIFGGGAHAGRRVDVQDFMIMVPGAESFEEALEITAEIYRAAGAIMSNKGQNMGVADEGGWWPVFGSNEEALETLVQAIEIAGEVPGERVVISLDIAASEFSKDGRYRLALEDRELGRDEMIRLLGDWIDAYPIVSIEDPLAEDDTEGIITFTKEFGERIQIIGDDYFVTNDDLVSKAAWEGACNAVLIKVNQSGTVSESMDCFNMAVNRGYGAVVSARSGETEDVTISHLAVGLAAGQLKVGSFTRSERMAKWNECLRIADQSGAGEFVKGTPLTGTWWTAEKEGDSKL
ncbi:MAG: phosphopyruvate hydratase [Granulosicoccus sp.]